MACALSECEDGKYGVNCVYSCGNCAKGDPCDHVNGTCPMGCKTGYDGRKCNGKLDFHKFVKCYNCLRYFFVKTRRICLTSLAL